MGQKRAKRRRRDRKREKRAALPPEQQQARRKSRTRVLAGAVTYPWFRRKREGALPPWGAESPGDRVALSLPRDDPEEPEGGAAVREPRRPKPHAPMQGAAALEPPPPEDDEPASAVGYERP